MTTQIAVRLPDDVVDIVDASVSSGRFATRTAFIRTAIEELARREREHEIADEYRRAYTAHPQEEWIGRLGVALLDALVEAEERNTGNRPL
jgi:Arc/MetJ-type ribon-helix-helix transcriptional regulator